MRAACGNKMCIRDSKRIKVGDLILVCDVGGGTTDFSLITVSEENGDLALKRCV